MDDAPGYGCRLDATPSAACRVGGGAHAVRRRDAPAHPSRRDTSVRAWRHADEIPGDVRLVPQPARHAVSAAQGLRSRGPRERLSRGRGRVRADPARRARRLRHDGPRREGGARAVRDPVRVPRLQHADLDVLALGEHRGLPASAAGVGPAGPFGASAWHRSRPQDSRRCRTLGLRGLGQDEGRSLAGSQQLALRLGHELPAVRESREVLLQVRALALPVRGALAGGTDPCIRDDAARVAVAVRGDRDLDGWRTRADT